MKVSLIRSKIKLNSIGFGQKCFYIATLLLATTNFLSAILYLISLIISFTNNLTLFRRDKWNLYLFATSIIFIISTLNISITQNSNSIYEMLRDSSWDASSIWFNLFNWIPYFIAFTGFQIYIKTEEQRIKFAKFLFLGLIPVIVSILLQKWFQIYGPFKYLNGLIIFYLKPIEELGGFAGLFSNPNYAGIWLSALLPFIFIFLNFYKNKKIKFLFSIAMFTLTIYCIICTNSRNSFLGIFIATTTMAGAKFLIFLSLAFAIIYVVLLGISSLSFVSLTGVSDFLPDTIFKKFFQTNYFSKIQSPRIDIWGKTINLILERPIFGWGAATFSTLYILRGGISDAQHTHNMPLQIAHNNGIPAAIILALFVSYLFLKSWRLIFYENKDIKCKINKAWICSILIIIISHLTDITYFDGRVSILSWVLLSGLKCIIDEDRIKEETN